MVATQGLRAEKLFSVKGYVAVVTGGGTGIGLMATQALAANGARVYITGRRMEVLENAAKSHTPSDGGEIIPIGPCDVTKKTDIESLVAQIREREKHIHILITNAGISGPRGNPDSENADELKQQLFSESEEEWQDVFNTNVASVYFTTVAFLPLLQAGGQQSSKADQGEDDEHLHFQSSVIVISSMSGIMSHAQGHFSYNAAKGATVHISKLMAAEFKKAGVRVNSIAPGYFPSEMTTKDSDEQNKSQMAEENVKEKGHVPMGRAGADEEMAMAVLFLARDRYVNGEVVAVDGGVLLEVPGR